MIGLPVTLFQRHLESSKVTRFDGVLWLPICDPQELWTYLAPFPRISGEIREKRTYTPVFYALVEDVTVWIL